MLDLSSGDIFRAFSMISLTWRLRLEDIFLDRKFGSLRS